MTGLAYYLIHVLPEPLQKGLIGRDNHPVRFEDQGGKREGIKDPYAPVKLFPLFFIQLLHESYLFKSRPFSLFKISRQSVKIVIR